ncbi:MAG: ferric reductase-like transmembrane domain-containing protein [Alicyclobacillus sp.]|nr:ferric reductase-like transmembrane domain-containing protein [Alicyclobacillus sp.]
MNGRLLWPVILLVAIECAVAGLCWLLTAGGEPMPILREEQKAPTTFLLAALCAITGGILVFSWVTGDASTMNTRFWILERSAGFMAYGLLSLTAILGVSMTAQLWDRWKLRKFANDIHQYAMLLVPPFLFLHLWGLYHDRMVPFPVASLILPWMSNYRRAAVTLGVGSLYLFLALVATSYARTYIGAKVWRKVHFAAFPLFLGTTLHGLLAGTDSQHFWAKTIYLVPLGLFTLLTLNRFLKSLKLKQGGHAYGGR